MELLINLSVVVTFVLGMILLFTKHVSSSCIRGRDKKETAISTILAI